MNTRNRSAFVRMQALPSAFSGKRRTDSYPKAYATGSRERLETISNSPFTIRIFKLVTPLRGAHS